MAKTSRLESGESERARGFESPSLCHLIIERGRKGSNPFLSTKAERGLKDNERNNDSNILVFLWNASVFSI